jgi:hypothetical protein
VGGDDDIESTAREDALIESAVLSLVLAHHPTQLTLVELLRQIVDDPGSFAERDAVERAVRDLAGAGLLHRNGEIVLPTLAALRFDELQGG